ncbi:hypothetical protein [Shimazuella alba]|uniref:Uncharacterized protein n=1 Tax=Shimazuella alba TaxID=2690964 RepID=A0A6I4W160_9BACL|nr:hypothetical protein [Shimazuella alba]MXQ54454.1 hypothetical protein [Shimazuella alba]
MLTPYRPFSWANPFFDATINNVAHYYGITREWHSFAPPVRNSNLAKQLIKKMIPIKWDDQKSELHGERRFYTRLQLLLKTMNTDRVDAIRLMLQAVRHHFDADKILADTLECRCREKSNENVDEAELAAAIWEELATSPERVRLLDEADKLQQQVELLLD